MSYPKTNQTRSGTIQEDSRNSKKQPGSRSNQEASNSAKGSAFAGSDNYPSAESKAKPKQVRAEGTGPIQAPGYVPVGGPSPSPHKVGNTIRRVKG